MLYKINAQTVRQHARAKQISAEELAAGAKCSTGTIRALYNEYGRNFREKTTFAIARTLGVDVDDIAKEVQR